MNPRVSRPLKTLYVAPDGRRTKKWGNSMRKNCTDPDYNQPFVTRVNEQLRGIVARKAALHTCVKCTADDVVNSLCREQPPYGAWSGKPW